jgi:hypothetical protein
MKMFYHARMPSFRIPVVMPYVVITCVFFGGGLDSISRSVKKGPLFREKMAFQNKEN